LQSILQPCAKSFLLIYAKKLLFPELCKQRSFKKEIFVFGEFEGFTPQCPGLPLNARGYHTIFRFIFFENFSNKLYYKKYFACFSKQKMLK
jgi:hypothetical protein